MHLNLINLFSFYIAVMFLIGTWRRLGQYHVIGALVVSGPGRWPRLLKLIQEHRAIFLGWGTLRPALIALVILTVNLICSRLIFPQAKVTLHDLWEHPIWLPLVIGSGLAMLTLDSWFVYQVAAVDRGEIEKQLDRAEFWLSEWKGTVLRRLTFGKLDPRRIVSDEVRQTLEWVAGLVNSSLWWLAVQVGLRVTFGLCVWLSWTFGVPHSPGE